MQPTKPAKPSWRALWDLWGYFVLLGALLLWMVWWTAPILVPLHLAIVRRVGVALGLELQLGLWLAIVLIWRRVPAMPGLMQGAICIVGWLWIGTGILGWLAFAAGTLCGHLGL